MTMKVTLRARIRAKVVISTRRVPIEQSYLEIIGYSRLHFESSWSITGDSLKSFEHVIRVPWHRGKLTIKATEN